MVLSGDFLGSFWGCSFLGDFMVQWHFWQIRFVFTGGEVNSCFDFFLTMFLVRITVLTVLVDFPLYRDFGVDLFGVFTTELTDSDDVSGPESGTSKISFSFCGGFGVDFSTYGEEEDCGLFVYDFNLSIFPELEWLS